MISRLDDPTLASALFGNWPEGMIWACLQGSMGAVFADGSLSSAAAILGDFAFFAGQPSPELIKSVSAPLLVPQDSAWADAIAACWGTDVRAITRYATRKDTVFDRETLQTYAASLPNFYTIRIIGEELYNMCLNTAWSQDLVSQYPAVEAYRKQGQAWPFCGTARWWPGRPPTPALTAASKLRSTLTRTFAARGWPGPEARR